MNLKETLLIAALLLSIGLILLTFSKLNKMEIKGGKRTFLIYLTLVVPILGFFMVNKMSRSKNNHIA